MASPMSGDCRRACKCLSGGVAKPPSRIAERLSAYGDLPNRAMRSGAAVCPAFLEGFFLWGYTSIFFVVMRNQRRAVASNLRAILGGPRWLSRLRSFRVVRQFAWTCLDSVRARLDEGSLEWRLEGRQWFEQLTAEPGGALVITAHMGSYDVAARCFCRRFPRPLHIVRTPEREENFRRLHERELQPEADIPLHVHYNEPGAHLGVLLAQVLAQGDFVAVQGDRVLFDVSGHEAECDGLRCHLPRGPFVLAAMGNVPAYPLFIVRDGWRRFVMRAAEPIHPEAAPDRGNDRAAKIQMAWLSCFLPVLYRHWSQWFVFEPAMTAVPAAAGRHLPPVSRPDPASPRQGGTRRDPQPAWLGLLFTALFWTALTREALPWMPRGGAAWPAWIGWWACLPAFSFVVLHGPVILVGNLGGWMRRHHLLPTARQRDHLQEAAAAAWMLAYLALRDAPAQWPWFRHLAWLWTAAVVVRTVQWAAWYRRRGRA